jgi:hypothetical protein
LPERNVKAASLARRTKLLSTGHFIPVMHAPIFMRNAQTLGFQRLKIDVDIRPGPI